jgi:hypothetical protein
VRSTHFLGASVFSCAVSGWIVYHARLALPFRFGLNLTVFFPVRTFRRSGASRNFGPPRSIFDSRAPHSWDD